MARAGCVGPADLAIGLNELLARVALALKRQSCGGADDAVGALTSHCIGSVDLLLAVIVFDAHAHAVSVLLHCHCLGPPAHPNAQGIQPLLQDLLRPVLAEDYRRWVGTVDLVEPPRPDMATVGVDLDSLQR